MTFQLFDRDEVLAVPAGPLVKIDSAGQMLINPECWGFLAESGADGPSGEVALLFDPETRQVGLQSGLGPDVPTSARWRPRAFRGRGWPRGVGAKQFVDHFRLAPGIYPVRLHRGPGPRMAVFEPGVKPEEASAVGVRPEPAEMSGWLRERQGNWPAAEPENVPG